MRSLHRALLGAIALGVAAMSLAAESPLDFTVKSIAGEDVDLSQYRGKVVLIVNVASKCGFTKQYKGLQALYEEHADEGLVVLGFPANNFARQEPGTDAEIQAFCTQRFNVTFPMFSKVSVKGKDKCELYAFLTSKEVNPKFGGEIGWNFTKFLIGRDGQVVQRFSSPVAPQSKKLTAAVEAELAKPQP